MAPTIICCDFDGTIVDHCFPKIGEPCPGSFDWLHRWQELGARLILWTMRNDHPEKGERFLSDAVEFCRSHGIEFWGINDNPEQASWTNSRKVYAHIYVDDAAWGCPLVPNPRPTGRPMVDWSAVGPAVERILLNGAG